MLRFFLTYLLHFSKLGKAKYCSGRVNRLGRVERILDPFLPFTSFEDVISLILVLSIKSLVISRCMVLHKPAFGSVKCLELATIAIIHVNSTFCPTNLPSHKAIIISQIFDFRALKGIILGSDFSLVFFWCPV